MSRELNIKIHYFLLGLLAFLMPLLPHALPVLIVLLALNRLAYAKYTGLQRTRAEWTALVFFAGLYLVYLAGMLYTEHTQTGWKDLETKLSLIIFPLVLFFGWKTDDMQTKKILRFFIWGCVASGIYSVSSSFYDYYKGLEAVRLKLPDAWNFGINTFLSSRLTKHFHPSYLSMYVNLAIMAVFYVNGWPRKKMSLSQYLLALALLVFVLFINAKSGLLFLAVIVIWYVAYLVIKQKKYLQSAIAFASFIVLALVLWFAAPEFRFKIEHAILAAKGENVTPDPNESSAGRRVIWRAAGDLIKEQLPLGTGTGDAKEVLIERYKEIGFMSGYRERLNCHNQFLQTTLAIGLGGIVFLLGALLFPAYHVVKQKKYLHLLFILLIVINFLSESMLETQAGVIFFAFFSSFFMYTFTGRDRLEDVEK